MNTVDRNNMYLWHNLWTLFFLCAVVMVQLLVTACSKDDEKDATILEVSPESLLLIGDDEGVLTITSNGQWSVSTTADWLSFSAMSGVGNGNVVIYAINSSPSNRMAIVTVTGKSAIRQVVLTHKVGTLETPFTVADAINYTKSFNQGESDKEVYIKGYITSITEEYSTNFGNGTFVMSDSKEGGNTFTFYRGLYLGNQRYTSGQTQIKVGDEVIVYGKVVNFRGNTPETVQGKAYLYSLNGKTYGGGVTPTPQPSGEVKTATVAAFNAAVESTDVWYQLTGTVKNLKDGDQYGDFDLEDATGSVYVYGLLSEKDGEKKKFQDLVAAKGITNGCTLTIIGTRGSYNDKIEVMNAYFVSIEGGATSGGGGSDTPGGGTVVTSLTNGDFEAWSGDQPTGWKSASTASSAKLAQSTDAHGGSYSVNVNGDESSNKRLASQEITLAAGTYVFSFYAKATTPDASQVRPGYVPVTDGKVGSYAYGNYADLSNTSWTQVSHEFTLDTETTVCLVVMNPKKSNYSSGKDILIDNAVLYNNSK